MNIILSLANNWLLRCCVALGLSIACWWHYNTTRIVEKWYHVPCCFYNYEHKTIIDAPETIDLCLRAQCRTLQLLDSNTLALHIDVSTLSLGKQRLSITHEELFLPETIKVVHYKPIHAYITVAAYT